MRFLNRHYRKCCILVLGVMLIGLVSGCARKTQASESASPMEVIHASYLDLSANVTDLRSRLTQWQKGDEASLKIAEEKLQRIEIVLASVSWPKEMSAAIDKTKAAVAPMAKVIKEKDLNGAEAASKGFGDASHDVTHAFYGDWLPAIENTPFTKMATHVGYLDLNANLADLQSRVSQWEKGDESSLNIAKEKADRSEILLRHMASSGDLAKRLKPIAAGLPAVFSAIEQKDVAASQLALKPIGEASKDLTRDAYVWLDLAGGPNDAACVQASYLDLTRNVTDLRAGITAWQKGDEKGLSTASEKLARVETLVAHPSWPAQMTTAIDRTKGAMVMMANVIKDKDLNWADTASKEFGDASHDVTHAYYGDWLTTGQLKNAKVQVIGSVKTGASGNAQANSQTQSSSSGDHPHGTVAGSLETVDNNPNWTIIGGFLAIFALVVIVAGVTKPKASLVRVMAASEPYEG